MKKAKAEEVIVHNLADLIEVLEDNGAFLAREIKLGKSALYKHISKNSRRITILSGIVIGFVIFSGYQQQKLDEQIYNLSVRVKKLENKEGE